MCTFIVLFYEKEKRLKLNDFVINTQCLLFFVSKFIYAHIFRYHNYKVQVMSKYIFSKIFISVLVIQSELVTRGLIRQAHLLSH